MVGKSISQQWHDNLLSPAPADWNQGWASFFHTHSSSKKIIPGILSFSTSTKFCLDIYLCILQMIKKKIGSEIKKLVQNHIAFIWLKPGLGLKSGRREIHSDGGNANWHPLNYHPVEIIMNDKLLHLMMLEELPSPPFICICARHWVG